MSNALLSGVRVVDLCQFLPGPYATHLLAALGAAVVKVEPPSGDPMRAILKQPDESSSTLYQLINAGKVVIRIDLKSAAGKTRLANLLQSADVLLDGYRPGVLARLGFGEAELGNINPRLIACSLSGWGQSGPYSQRAGHDINYCALAGIHSQLEDEQTPNLFPLSADHVGGMQAVISILAALVGRNQSGQGCRLDISLYETLLSWRYTECQAGFRAMLSGGAAYYNVYRSADGRNYTLGAIELKFWQQFCAIMARPEWVERYAEPFPQSALISEVRAYFANQDSTEIDRLFSTADCCLEKVPWPEEVLTHEQARHRRLMEGGLRYPGWINGGPGLSLKPLCELQPNENFDWENML